MHEKTVKNKIYFIITLVAVALILSLIAGTLYAHSKNTTLLGLFSGDDGNQRVASYNIQIDGKPDNKIDFKAYATTKLSDIEKNGDSYKGHSFREGAYQLHTIKVKNDSEVVTNCNLDMITTTNDNRVFSAVIPDITDSSNEADVLKAIYTNTDISTPDKVRDYIQTISLADKSISFDAGESKTFTMIVWSEHDAVFPDNDGDGVADEDGKKLSELTKGIPSETYTLDYTFEQAD